MSLRLSVSYYILLILQIFNHSLLFYLDVYWIMQNVQFMNQLNIISMYFPKERHFMRGERVLSKVWSQWHWAGFIAPVSAAGNNSWRVGPQPPGLRQHSSNDLDAKMAGKNTSVLARAGAGLWPIYLDRDLNHDKTFMHILSHRCKDHGVKSGNLSFFSIWLTFLILINNLN